MPLMIQGPKQPDNDIDVYLEPLVDDLLKLWEDNGYNGCVVCLDKTEARWLNHSKKMVYMGHRRFLPLNHPYRKNKKII